MTGFGAERLQERSSSGLLGRCRSTGASTCRCRYAVCSQGAGTLLQISAMAAMLPSRAPTRKKGKHWHLAVTTVSRKITIPNAPRGDLRHRLKASVAANTQGRQQGWGNGGRGAPAHQRAGRQYQRSGLQQPLRQAPPHPQQPQQRP
ncbi:UNVERIFIED_CONTAM: hypothetical protein FKN15_061763 [Acipenser sinensis]